MKTNEPVFAELHTRFLEASSLGRTGNGWEKETAAIAVDAISRLLERLRAEGLEVGVYYHLSAPEAPRRDAGWALALSRLSLKYVRTCGRGKVYVTYVRNAVRDALIAPPSTVHSTQGWKVVETYNVEELGCFRGVEHVKAVGLFTCQPTGVEPELSRN